MKQQKAPSFFLARAEGDVAPVHADGTPVGRPERFPEYTARPARPGDAVLLFGNGLGATDPPHSAATVVEAPAPLAGSKSVTIGNVPTEILYAGLIMPGLYQINVNVPELVEGDHPVLLNASGFQTQTGATIAVQSTLPNPSNRPIIVDHTTVDLSRIPAAWIERARQNLRMYYGHTSHGAQITEGMHRLESQLGFGYSIAIGETLPSKAGAFNILDFSAYDWNPDFYPTVDRVLAANRGINLVMYMWCGQAGSANWEALFNEYVTGMQALEQKYPRVVFVYETGNAQEQDCPGCVRQLFNERVRKFARQNAKVLFDFADLDAWHNGALATYAAPNWCSKYGCSAGAKTPYEHPQWGGGNYNNPCGHTTYESCDNKAKAMWWLLARVAGWNGF